MIYVLSGKIFQQWDEETKTANEEAGASSTAVGKDECETTSSFEWLRQPASDIVTDFCFVLLINKSLFVPI